MAGKIVLIIYITGYWLYVILAGIMMWSSMGFSEWRLYILFQAFYALVWPVWLVKAIIG